MGYYSRWPKYVPVAKWRQQALHKVEKLKETGVIIHPIKLASKKIATTFWGKAWCTHIGSFSDYENRLPRGRTYIRNGLICHLAIESGLISAIVAGSELYNIRIKIKTLAPDRWGSIKKTCLGKVGSLLELLSGQLSDGVMEVVCDRTTGIFPTPKEIELSCDCPDWATMCKHVAAVLYGVGARLDVEPAQLFKLRGVNHEELIDVKAAIADVTKASISKDRYLAEPVLSQIFDIDLATDEASEAKNVLSMAKEDKQKVVNNINNTIVKKHALTITGTNIKKKRQQLKLSQAALAIKLGVSVATIAMWESKGRKKLVLKNSSLQMLQKFLF